MWAIPHKFAVRYSFRPRRPDPTLSRHSAQVFLTNSGSRLHANGRSLKSKVPAGIAVSPATRCLPRPSADASDSKPLRKMVESLLGVSLLPLLLLLSFLFFSTVVLVAYLRGGRRELVVAGEHAASPTGDVHRTRTGRCFESEQAFLSALTRVAARTFSCVSRLPFGSSGSARCDTTGEDGSSSRSKRRSMPSVPSFDPSLLWFLDGACGIFNAVRVKYVEDTDVSYPLQNEGLSRCRTAPRYGFSVFEITRCGSVRFSIFQNPTVWCGAVRILIFKNRTVRCGAVILSTIVVFYAVVERAPKYSRKIGVPQVYTVAAPYKKLSVRVQSVCACIRLLYYCRYYAVSHLFYEQLSTTCAFLHPNRRIIQTVRYINGSTQFDDTVRGGFFCGSGQSALL